MSVVLITIPAIYDRSLPSRDFRPKNRGIFPESIVQVDLWIPGSVCIPHMTGIPDTISPYIIINTIADKESICKPRVPVPHAETIFLHPPVPEELLAGSIAKISP